MSEQVPLKLLAQSTLTQCSMDFISQQSKESIGLQLKDSLIIRIQLPFTSKKFKTRWSEVLILKCTMLSQENPTLLNLKVESFHTISLTLIQDSSKIKFWIKVSRDSVFLEKLEVDLDGSLNKDHVLKLSVASKIKFCIDSNKTLALNMLETSIMLWLPVVMVMLNLWEWLRTNILILSTKIKI